ncbi:MAG: P-II family nitrogen regulator [Fidelibacterota bacterium]
MKLIQAYIKPHRLPEVTLALHKVRGLTGMSIVDVRGFGRRKTEDTPHHVVDDVADFVPHVKIEIFCGHELVNEIVSTVQNTSHTGLRGDGKIYVSTIDEALRISTGERGKNAI